MSAGAGCPLLGAPHAGKHPAPAPVLTPTSVGTGAKCTAPVPMDQEPRLTLGFFIYNVFMLDEGKFVYSIDRGNALGLVAGQSTQLKQRFNSEIRIPKSELRNIVLAGMGGSALAGEFVRHWLGDRLKLPFTIVRGYDLPGFVDANSLVFVSSYSGNTEETLAAYTQAKAKKAKIVVLSAGGKLSEAATSDKLPLIQIPSGIQPRLAALFMVKALAVVFEKAALAKDITSELEQAADWLEGQSAAWVQTVPANDNLAKQVAEKLLGNSAVIYAGATLAAIAQRWKISLNENAKNVAFYYELPEFNHNEMVGWLNPQTKPIKVIQLQSSLDNGRIAKRWEVSNRLLSGKMPSPIEIKAAGKTKLEQMLWAQMLGDFVGVYLGILNKVDPASVDLIEKLKKELS